MVHSLLNSPFLSLSSNLAEAREMGANGMCSDNITFSRSINMCKLIEPNIEESSFSFDLTVATVLMWSCNSVLLRCISEQHFLVLCLGQSLSVSTTRNKIGWCIC